MNERTLERLQQLEGQIDEGLGYVIATAQALYEIWYLRLFELADYPSFKAYAEDRFDISVNRIYSLIAFAEVREVIPVENPTQARAIHGAVKLDPDEVRKDFERNVDRLNGDERKAVKKLVRDERKAVKKLVRDELHKKADPPETVGNIVPPEPSQYRLEVHVVLGEQWGSAHPEVRVAADRAIALSIRDAMTATGHFKNVVIRPCKVERQLQREAVSV